MPIEVKNLTHIYMEGTPFEARALDSVSLSIRDGEFIGVIGHTGSGKSTLIAHLNALDRPEPGTVFVNGMDLGAKDADLAKVRRTVGLVFQYPEYQLFEETVAKDIAFGPRNLKLPEDEVQARVRRAMEMVGLAERYADRSPFDLSGGQKRRAAIAGVLAMALEARCYRGGEGRTRMRTLRYSGRDALAGGLLLALLAAVIALNALGVV